MRIVNCKYSDLETEKIEKVTITAENARELLKLNGKNRPLKSKHLSFLISELVAGRWRFNGDAIRIGGGVLIDGQHRLEAVARSGIAIETLLITGLNPETFVTIDTGAVRSAADTLFVAGEKNARNLASALRFVNDFNYGNIDNNRTEKYSNTEILAWNAQYPEVKEFLRWGWQLKHFASPSIVVGLCYLFSRKARINNDLIAENAAEVFFETLLSGAGLTFGDPIYTLRQRLIRNSTSKGKLTRRYIAALIIKTWNAFINSRQLKVLRFTEFGEMSESFPDIEP